MSYTGLKLKAYYSWKNLKARAKAIMESEWLDFEKYYADVGDKPSQRHRLHRKDINSKWGPDNFYWKEDLFNKKYKTFDSKQYLKDWRKANPSYFREVRYIKKYGITVEKYEEMGVAQKHRCFVCGKHESQSQQGTVRQLAVDHDHRTGVVRKLLDNNCNAILGHANDSAELLAKLIIYLDHHSNAFGSKAGPALTLIEEYLRRHQSSS